ncbi:hypothetical protein QOZ80_4BG0336250 [Eleusine coracana subsp. coracana]|nr:hypothetical protein QOZ80_4BG0336250 [Eleusine coracana subsp. coracana]
MARGSERRSAAAEAAAAARPQPLMSTLALALSLMSTMPRAAFSQGLHQNMTCDNVPYPFGVRSAPHLRGFEVICGPNREAMLPIDENLYQINDVSVPESYVAIFAGPIRQVCYDRDGNPTPDTGTGAMSLEGTPFTFSKRNNLIGIGCNYKLVATNFTKPSGRVLSDRAICTTSCYGPTVGTSSCSGEACCEVDIPASQSFTLSFQRTTSGNATTGEEAGACSTVFLLDKVEQVYMSKDGDEGTSRPLREALLPPGERRMILDWAIGNSTCDQAQAQGYNFDSLCKDMSVCVNSPRGAGYLCRCPQGNGGNPYVSGGCEGSPPPQLQGSSDCNKPENNPCTYINYCNNLQGFAVCACPRGMSGDGRKKGTGCQKNFPLDIVLGVGLALVVTITAAVVCLCWAMKKRQAERKRSELFRKNGGVLLQQKFSAITSQKVGSSAKIFSAEELKTATDNYSETRILGRGGHGTVYKGILSDKTMVAIKKSKVFDESQVEQFVNEIAILSQIDHPNVVKLFGCCLETQVPLLVYEFVPNGTLFDHIHNRDVACSLTWEDSLRIATEIAEALAYLHSTSSVPIIHRDIKSSNILLDENFVAKIADFGASRSVPFDQTHVTTLIQGTIGYLDPEYFQSSQLTEKSDVYSFGVVLAELLTRQKPIPWPEESRNLAMHLVVLFNEGSLLQEIEPQILAEAGKDQLYAVAELSAGSFSPDLDPEWGTLVG